MINTKGKVSQVEIDDIVVGDLIMLQSGDKIPADGILIDGKLIVDNSALNGETEGCKKIAAPMEYDVFQEVAITGDTFVDKHSLFRGTVITEGEGLMRVTKVGMNTMMGAMAKDMAGEEIDSPLKVKLTNLADAISKMGYIMSIIIALAFLIHKVTVGGGIGDYITNTGGILILKDVLDAIMLAVVIIVMAVPEGLPLMIAIVLMKNTSKMLENNVLVRKPIGIETAGSLNILFSDKTGTITKNEFKVIDFFDGNILNSYEKSPVIKEITNLCIGKNTSAMFDKDNNIVGGNETDRALLEFITQKEFEGLSDYTVKKYQEFNSTNKYSAAQLDEVTVYKGAPDILLGKATKYIDAKGKIINIDKEAINKKIDEFADRTMRVIAFAYSESGLIENTLPEDLIIVGFVGIRDDIRPEAKIAIKEVQNAGVQVVMMTGDRKETAIAIAKEVGLIKTDKDLAFTSQELNSLSDEEVKEKLPHIKVIARALPTDKSRMVRLAQELNLVCGMTGDGVNDAPALKKADVGFAMGSGTDVAKEASEIVILDNNFKSIESAILYGRTIYNNILKFIKFQLTINVGAVLVSAIAPFLGVEEPLKITHILWINLVMDGLGALALGAEPALKKYMNEKPKSRTQSLVTKKTLGQVVVAGGYLAIMSLLFLKLPFFINMFDTSEQHLTAYFSLFVLSAVFNGFNVRSEGIDILEHIKDNKGFIKVMSIIAIVQILLTLVGGTLFSCAPFGIKQWIIIIILASTMIPVDMIRKIVTKSK